jgi:hypothetical protein
LKPSLSTASGPDRRHRGGFYFFEKNLCREPLAKAVGKGGFSIFFLKIVLCRVSGAEAVGKDGFSIFF